MAMTLTERRVERILRVLEADGGQTDAAELGALAGRFTDGVDGLWDVIALGYGVLADGTVTLTPAGREAFKVATAPDPDSEYDHERWMWDTFFCTGCGSLYCRLPEGQTHCRACGDGIPTGSECGCWLED